MTRLLERAFAEAAKLPPAEQDALAQRWLAELSGEPVEPELSEDEKRELERRLAAHEASPSDVIPLGTNQG